MFFFGWGQKRREFAPDQVTRLVVAYTYAHLMFIFTVAWSPQYYVATWTDQGWASRQVTREEATMLNAGVTPDIHPWWKYSWAILALNLVVSIILLALL